MCWAVRCGCWTGTAAGYSRRYGWDAIPPASWPATMSAPSRAAVGPDPRHVQAVTMMRLRPKHPRPHPTLTRRVAVLGAILRFAVGNAAATSGLAVAGDAAAVHGASPTGTVALLVDALNRGDSARAAALFTADAVLFQAQAQVWVDQETGIASDPFGTGLYIPSRQLPPGPDGTTAWAVGQDAVRRWLHELAGRHVAITTDNYRAAGDRAEWDFAATFDAAPHLAVAAALWGHASAELRGGSLA